MSATKSVMASRNTSEKGRAGGRATKLAREEQHAADEVQAAAKKERMSEKSVGPGDVPPFCYLSPELSPDESAVIAVRELRISLPIDALAMLWKMRRVAQGDAK